MKYWLKIIGTEQTPPDATYNHLDVVHFPPVLPNVSIGDKIIVYGYTSQKIIFACEVTSTPQLSGISNYPYLLQVNNLTTAHSQDWWDIAQTYPNLSDKFEKLLPNYNVCPNGNKLTLSMRRQSHVEITPEFFFFVLGFLNK